MTALPEAVMVVFTFILALGVSIFLLTPFFKKSAYEKDKSSPENEAHAQKEFFLRELTELEFDFRTGKLLEEHYQKERALLETKISDLALSHSSKPKEIQDVINNG